MIDQATVTVIIPTYCRYDCLGPLLEALSGQVHAADEILVADQSPADLAPEGFYEQYAALPLHVIRLDEPSISKPRNVAAAAATGDILLFLDDDVVVDELLIDRHLAVLTREQVDVVNGGVFTNRPALPKEYPWDISQLDPVRLFLAGPGYEWQGMMLGVSSCNFSIRRELFLEVEGFDEHMPRMVDFELGYRLFRHGAKIYYSSEPCVRHLRAPGGSRKHPERHDRTAAALYLHKKHFPGWTTTQFGLKLVVGPYLRRWTLKTPFVLPFTLYRFLRANAEANRRARLAGFR